jgi:hypothetical protein
MKNTARRSAGKGRLFCDLFRREKQKRGYFPFETAPSLFQAKTLRNGLPESLSGDRPFYLPMFIAL